MADSGGFVLNISLTAAEVRVLGALIEKERTTPENYPLSLNALCSACNQKTNREPVTSLGEPEVLDAVESLVEQTLAARRASAGSRVDKFAHRLNHRLTDENNFAADELAVLCVLMLRGAQTAGELRARAARLHEFASVADVEQTLNALAARDDGPFVRLLPRRAGRKEPRYDHLLAELSETASDAAPETGAGSDPPAADLRARLDQLEDKVERLSRRVETLERSTPPDAEP